MAKSLLSLKRAVETQKQVGRVARLRNEIENLQVQLQEREVVLKAYDEVN